MFICCGGLRVDYILTAEGEWRVHEMGGNALYAAAGARLWGARVGLLARVGENYPEGWLAKLRQYGLEVSGIHAVLGSQEMRTFYAYLDPQTRSDTNPARHLARFGIPLPDDLKDYVHSTPGQDDPDHYEPLAVIPEDWIPLYDHARALHLSPISIRTHMRLPARARAAGVPQVTADPGERYMTPHLLPYVKKVLEQVDVFLPSEQEIRSLLGEVDLWDAAKEFASFGPNVVVAKVGERGALVYERDRARCTHVPAFPGRVVDTTGAGDSFCGGFMLGLAETGDPIRAAKMGAISASFAIEDYGALHILNARRLEADARLNALEAVSR